MLITVSKNANKNYLAKVVKINKLEPIEGADRIQSTIVDFQNIVVSKDIKIGDIVVYFPIECAINKEFLSFTNSFRDKTLNKDTEQGGFFEDKGRVRAIRLLQGRVKSMGYIVPIREVTTWAFNGCFDDEDAWVGQEFDTINNIKLLEKYVVVKKEGRTKQGKQPKISRLVEGQVKLHVDTENLRRNPHKIKPSDDIAISYKTHGTSWWVGNLKVKRKLTWVEKLLTKLGVKIDGVEYDYIYGSRKVVKNESLEDPKRKDHFYGYDLWEGIKDEVKDTIPKGFTLYGEALGYDKNGGYIQKPYDYGMKQGEMKLEVYRITVTNDDGFTTELSHSEIREFCNKRGLNTSVTFFQGKAKEIIPDIYVDERDWEEAFIRELENRYNEKNCFICTNVVPEEGIVVRKENLFEYEAYKLKSFNFLEFESASLDKGESDIESEN